MSTLFYHLLRLILAFLCAPPSPHHTARIVRQFPDLSRISTERMVSQPVLISGYLYLKGARARERRKMKASVRSWTCNYREYQQVQLEGVRRMEYMRCMGCMLCRV